MPLYERADGTYEGVPKGCTVSRVTRLETTYGNYPGGDPREFSPDPDSNPPHVLLAHARACRAWDAAERRGKPGPETRAGGCEFKQIGDAVLKIQRGGEFGVGTYRVEMEALEVVYPDGSVRWFF